MNFTRPLILASRSPRRKQLVEQLGLSVIVQPMDIEETYPDTLDPYKVPEYLARKKALAFEKITDNAIILTGDTVVILDNKILEKPADRNEAINMLSSLSGKKHDVVSGICLRDNSNIITASETTTVWFNNLSIEEISYYVDNYKPFDKAGAYGIQEWIGMIGVEKIEGSYFNVVGFPIHLVYQKLIQFNKGN
ncbi:Maf family nucleotide pyrophosphatase [Marinigracilibium pacificum]|uniref:dTTP/UTP pyrophosphatase n=1 Tax=Marinigracilibium pacificum TaxID=2729599 RepID=A0A848IY22_9BACT|nr:Maf family nucleotide pyrophosphatase [Marinigracilibium pacificum]NMM48068.1 septum formation protein Maf [Marinigracilibium pacificum]